VKRQKPPIRTTSIPRATWVRSVTRPGQKETRHPARNHRPDPSRKECFVRRYRKGFGMNVDISAALAGPASTPSTAAEAASRILGLDHLGADKIDGSRARKLGDVHHQRRGSCGIAQLPDNAVDKEVMDIDCCSKDAGGRHQRQR
jgi:hypothetical protein